jgi:hypothetical protein
MLSAVRIRKGGTQQGGPCPGYVLAAILIPPILCSHSKKFFFIIIIIVFTKNSVGGKFLVSASARHF